MHSTCNYTGKLSSCCCLDLYIPNLQSEGGEHSYSQVRARKRSVPPVTEVDSPATPSSSPHSLGLIPVVVGVLLVMILLLLLFVVFN